MIFFGRQYGKYVLWARPSLDKRHRSDYIGVMLSLRSIWRAADIKMAGVVVLRPRSFAA
jgi:hypothetical protein